uniref:Uncharacterized protein n=1 Tax=Plectus sambesii TaxID=2011161 RepID=A0A914UYY3_9BILA
MIAPRRLPPANGGNESLTARLELYQYAPPFETSATSSSHSYQCHQSHSLQPIVGFEPSSPSDWPLCRTTADMAGAASLSDRLIPCGVRPFSIMPQMGGKK